MYYKYMLFKKIFFIYFRAKGKEGKKHRSVASGKLPTGDLVHNPGMCPDWKSDHQAFSPQHGAQPAEPHQPGQCTS